MTKNKVMKVIVALLTVLLVLATFSQVCLASTDVDLNRFDSHGDNSNASNAATNIIGAIIDIARIIGAGVAIIMLIVLAIKYISASPEAKAEIKKSATYYIVGAILLFAASAVLTIIQQFAGNI